MIIEIFQGDEKRRAETAARMVPLFLDSRATAMPWLPVVRRPEEVLGYFRDIVLTNHNVALAYDGQALVGFAAWEVGELHHLYLAPTAQRKGLGTKLLGLAKEGQSSLELWVFQRNTPAVEFYRTHSFCIILATDGAENEEKSPDYRMRWDASAVRPPFEYQKAPE